MARYLLNSPVLTAYGDFRFEGPLGLPEARRFVAQGAESAIGHLGTARFLSGLLEVPVVRQRRAVRMEPGDVALVFQLAASRLPEGAVVDMDTLERTGHEFGLLTRMR